jgi:transcription elongation GreA/GreB family factor
MRPTGEAAMSRAFVRETDAEINDSTPDRPISPNPNFVTASGLIQIDAYIGSLTAARATAVHDDDQNALPGIDRDLRYWKQRRSSAREISPPSAPEIVRFGVSVQLQFEDGSARGFRLVGEDEAEPTSGLLSWTSPIGKALIGKSIGDTLEVFGRRAEIVSMHG